MIGGIQGGGMSAGIVAQVKEKVFNKLDGDGNGQIDLSTVEAPGDGKHFSKMMERLTAADADGDGMVSKAEFNSMRPPSELADRFAMKGLSAETRFNLLDYLNSGKDEEVKSELQAGSFLDMFA